MSPRFRPLFPADLETFAGSEENNLKSEDMKTIILTLAAIFLACVAQLLLIGVNGLTVLTIPLTIFLGFEVLEKLTEGEHEQTNI